MTVGSEPRRHVAGMLSGQAQPLAFAATHLDDMAGGGTPGDAPGREHGAIQHPAFCIQVDQVQRAQQAEAVNRTHAREQQATTRRGVRPQEQTTRTFEESASDAHGHRGGRFSQESLH